MRPMPPARSRRAVSLQQDNVDASTAVQVLHVSIPLKAQHTPAALPPRLTQAVKDEFAIRYLQQIDANSTPQNIAMVLQYLPLEKCAVSAAWKSRGSLADMLAIDLNPKALTQVGATPLKTEARGTKQYEPTGIEAQQLSPRRQLRGQQSRYVYRIGTVCFTFDDMKRKFLLPFKLATPPPEPDVLQLYGTRLEVDAGLTPNQTSHFRDPSAVPGTTTAQGTVGRWETQRRLKSVDERTVPPNPSTETVSEMHHEFYLTLPLTSLGLPEGAEHTRTVLYETLLSPAMVELVQSTYPTSFSCVSEEMDRMLQVIDARISQLLDPDANWSRLAVLETTHEAGQARASSSFQRDRRHRRLRDQFFQTSAVLHGLFPEPSSGNCRRVMTLRGGAGIGHYPELSSAPPQTTCFTPSSPAPKQDERRLPDKSSYNHKNVVPVSITSKLSLLRSLRRSQIS
uniref:Uncharacterized protein n=1 Tax=Phytophthora ramorum TaxID=164328 RepID=H3GBT7_PHYRM